eukprot:CAMPEP_0179000056 /NCGR_PEP_ID=MMETSP0795-20121207/10444_1 /TAXON_ID=88552 /ORGANISM="Amoebophrya sp., Strain Ameob2" /LENGTH=424 /DNA_ID=CAMNT_0020692979 /DNA_START=252 /DNA_END=1526 /DNA_ORIENTATION=-
MSKPGTVFGNPLPYCEPNWYCSSYKSPYYKQTHIDWRARCRDFVEDKILPYVSDWEAAKEIPKHVYKEAYAAGLIPCVVGSRGFDFVDCEKPKDYDYFHELIFVDELARCASGGTLWGIVEGLQIGLPPIINFGSKELQDKVCKPCLTGEKIICLAITEPGAGSDVANIKASAKKVGDHYVVNGEKKWITNGIFADFFSVAVRTGGPGMKGISMLLIEKTMPGVKTRRMDCQGVHPSGTTYVTFDEVKVPCSNLIGKENEGFGVIMKNFNHERWGFVVQATRFSRDLVEEAQKYALKRSTFGKKLIDHPVIRWKLAEMIRMVESMHHWLENLTYQMCHMPFEVAQKELGGTLALAKVNSSKVMEYCAREASQIFGGNAYTKSGLGEKVERLYRDVRAYAIPGGSEEILLDLGVREAVKLGKARM